MKTVFGITVAQSHDDRRGYRFLYLRMRLGTIEDAARTYKRDGTPAALDTLKTVRSETGDTLFFREQRDQEITLKWQSDFDRDDQRWRQWYGCKIEDGDFKPEPIAALLRLCNSLDERGFYADPGAIVTAILNAGGVALRNHETLSLEEWLIDTTNTALDRIVIDQPETACV